MGMRSRLKRATLSWPTPLSLLDILLSALVWLFSTEHLPECSSPGPGNTFCFLLGRSMYSLFVADETGRLYIQASFHSTSFSTLPFLLFWSNLANVFCGVKNLMCVFAPRSGWPFHLSSLYNWTLTFDQASEKQKAFRVCFLAIAICGNWGNPSNKWWILQSILYEVWTKDFKHAVHILQNRGCIT